MTTCPRCEKNLDDSLEYSDSRAFALLEGVDVSSPPREDNPHTTDSEKAKNLPTFEVEVRDVPSNVIEAIYLVIETISLCFRRIDVGGRSSRAEFWIWFIFNFCVVVIPLYVGILLGDAIYYSLYLCVIVCVSSIWGAVCVIPSITLCVRRFHDLDISGVPLSVLFFATSFWFVTSSFMAFIRNDYFLGRIFAIACGATLGIALLFVVVVALIPGAEGVNRFGAKPEKRRKDSVKSKSLDDSSEDKVTGRVDENLSTM